MEDYKTIVALVRVKEYRKAGKYEEAYEIVKGINLKKVSDIVDFNMLADVCNEVGEYEIAEKVYEIIYKKTGSKYALGSLLYSVIKLEKADRARELLIKYEQLEKHDPGRLIYRYRVQKLEKLPIEEQIATLELWSEEDYNEKWGAELAKLYHKAGDDQKCIAECDKIITWFGDGDYVDWARTLKSHLLGEIDVNELVARQKAMREAAEAEHQAEIEAIRAAYEAEHAAEEEARKAEEAEKAANAGILPAEEAEEEPEGQENTETETDENSEEVLPEITGYDSNSEFELAAMESIMKYLADNCSPNITLREEHDELPEIGGEFGEKVKSGEIVLEDLFGNYACMEGIRKQLIRSLDMIFDPLKKGDNLIITGGSRMGKTTLAKKLSKAMYKNGEISTTKALLTDAEKMNKMNLRLNADKLTDCGSIIIEKAGKLKKGTVSALLELIEKHEGNMVVFLEDQRKDINNLLRDNPDLNSVFNNRIHLPSEYKPAELKGFAYEYLIQEEYELEIPAVNVLEERIAHLIGAKEPDIIRATIDIIKGAINHAEERNSKILANMVKSGTIENADIMTIYSEDLQA